MITLAREHMMIFITNIPFVFIMWTKRSNNSIWIKKVVWKPIGPTFKELSAKPIFYTFGPLVWIRIAPRHTSTFFRASFGLTFLQKEKWHVTTKFHTRYYRVEVATNSKNYRFQSFSFWQSYSQHYEFIKVYLVDHKISYK